MTEAFEPEKNTLPEDPQQEPLESETLPTTLLPEPLEATQISSAEFAQSIPKPEDPRLEVLEKTQLEIPLPEPLLPELFEVAPKPQKTPKPKKPHFEVLEKTQLEDLEAAPLDPTTLLPEPPLPSQTPFAEFARPASKSQKSQKPQLETPLPKPPLPSVTLETAPKPQKNPKPKKPHLNTLPSVTLEATPTPSVESAPTPPQRKKPKVASTNKVQILVRDNIRIARKHYRLSQDSFGLIIGQTGSYISLVETGKRTITLELLEKLSQHFNIPLGYWFRESDQERILQSLEIEHILNDLIESRDIDQFYVHKTIEIRVWLKAKNFNNEEMKHRVREDLVKASKEGRTFVIFESL